jgi:transposase
MSTQVLYHGFGIRGYRHVRMTNQGGSLVFGIEQPREAIRCPDCSSQRVHCHGGQTRRWKCPPVGGKSVFVEMKVPRVACLDCRARKSLPATFAEPRRTYTRAFERYVWELSRMMTIQDIAVHLGVGWDLVKAIQKRHLERKYRKPRLRDLKRIAIDEISNSKGHKYLTIVLDLDSGRVVFVGKGKKEASLRPF